MATRRIRHELEVIATSAGMLLLAAGCSRTSGSSSDSASSASSAAAPEAETARDACTLLTEKDATAFLGADPGKGTHDPDDPSLHTCSYYTAKGKHNVVSLLVREKAGGETAAAVKSGLAAIENEFPSSQPVAGVGDAAVWIPEVRQLDFVKGTTMYLVTAGHGSLAEAKALALKVLGRS